jgi:hypothetical protein
MNAVGVLRVGRKWTSDRGGLGDRAGEKLEPTHVGLLRGFRFRLRRLEDGEADRLWIRRELGGFRGLGKESESPHVDSYEVWISARPVWRAGACIPSFF